MESRTRYPFTHYEIQTKSIQQYIDNEIFVKHQMVCILWMSFKMLISWALKRYRYFVLFSPNIFCSWAPLNILNWKLYINWNALCTLFDIDSVWASVINEFLFLFRLIAPVRKSKLKKQQWQQQKNAWNRWKSVLCNTLPCFIFWWQVTNTYFFLYR